MNKRIRNPLQRWFRHRRALPHTPLHQTFLSEAEFRKHLRKAYVANKRHGKRVCFALLELNELRQCRTYVENKWSRRTELRIIAQVARLIEHDHSPGEITTQNERGEWLILMPDTRLRNARRRLRLLSRHIASHPFRIANEFVWLTPVIGFASMAQCRSISDLVYKTRLALDYAATCLASRPVAFRTELEAAKTTLRTNKLFINFAERTRLPFQILLSFMVAWLIPFFVYGAFDQMGADIAWISYSLIVAGLCITAVFIWIETYLAFGAQEAPAKPAKPYPPASAIIAAYLPNEADTILETLDHFLGISYPNSLQVIFAYNTPNDMAIEQDLMVLAERHPNFLPYRVHGSTSKAQNINAAKGRCTGEFVGVFDADHWPDSGSFERAWRWLSNGFDIVQGHCLIRNGDDSWVARMVAVEFETIYAISFPGRAALHGFGIFSGSNGYWKTELLHRTRMDQFMLTEDIDSAFRVVNAGYKVASDRDLVSRELAPTKLQQLWSQRLRWAQGWLQSSIRWCMPSLTSGRLSTRQKFGIVHLTVCRELYAWVPIQMFPIITYWGSRNGWEIINWLVPIFVALLFTILTTIGQITATYFLAHPTVRNRRWWWWYPFVAFVFYSGFKNLITRVAHVKELMRDRVWRVTPRTRHAHVEPVGGKGYNG